MPCLASTSLFASLKSPTRPFGYENVSQSSARLFSRIRLPRDTSRSNSESDNVDRIEWLQVCEPKLYPAACISTTSFHDSEAYNPGIAASEYPRSLSRSSRNLRRVVESKRLQNAR